MKASTAIQLTAGIAAVAITVACGIPLAMFTFRIPSTGSISETWREVIAAVYWGSPILAIVCVVGLALSFLFWRTSKSRGMGRVVAIWCAALLSSGLCAATVVYVVLSIGPR